MAIPMTICKRSKNLYTYNIAQAWTPYYVNTQREVTQGRTYTISSNVPYAVPSNLNGINYGDEMVQFEVYDGHPVTLTVGEGGLSLFFPYIEQTAEQGTTVNTNQGLIDGTYWIQIEEGTEATAYEEPGVIEETYQGFICSDVLTPHFPNACEIDDTQDESEQG